MVAVKAEALLNLTPVKWTIYNANTLLHSSNEAKLIGGFFSQCRYQTQELKANHS